MRMPPEAPTDGKNSKLSKQLAQFFFDKLNVKVSPFCFLKAKDVTVAFFYFVSNGIPFLLDPYF